MGQWSEEQVQEAVKEINKKAMTDEAFRELCLFDAHAAVKEVTGHGLSKGN